MTPSSREWIIKKICDNMENKNKIIIVSLIGMVLILSAAIAGILLKEETKSVELFENGTTIQVPINTNLKSHNEFSTSYITDKNSTITGINNNNLAGALASKMLSIILVEKCEKQDNGLYKLDKNSVMEIGDQFGLEYDENNIIEGYIGIKHNNTVNQTVIIIGPDEHEIINILNSIHWKLGKQTNTSLDTTPNFESSQDKTYPFYGNDGSIMGYYHVGDTVDYIDNVYQLQPDGSWKYIGPSPNIPKPSKQDKYDEDDFEYDEDYDRTETTTDSRSSSSYDSSSSSSDSGSSDSSESSSSSTSSYSTHSSH